MKDAQLIYRWHRCEKLAGELGMLLHTNAESLSAQGTSQPGAHKSFYTCETVSELLGYLEGVTDAKTKMANDRTERPEAKL